jgi:hypothetical protein
MGGFGVAPDDEAEKGASAGLADKEFSDGALSRPPQKLAAL